MLDKPAQHDPLEQFTVPDIAVAITIQGELNGKRSLVMQTYVGRDAPLSFFNAVTDKLSAVMDRQRSKFDLLGLQYALEDAKKNMETAVRQSHAIEAKALKDWDKRGKKGAFHLSDTEAAQKQTFLTNVEACKANMAKIEAEIKELEALIAKVD